MNHILASPQERFVVARRSLADGDLDGAEQIYLQLSLEKPRPAASAGLASVEMRRGNWADAVGQWDAAMARFPHRIELSWRKSRAHALLKLGRHNDAIEEFYRILAMDVTNEMAQRGLLNSLMLTNQSGRALLALNDGVFKGITSSALQCFRSELHHRQIVSSGSSDDSPARQQFDEALHLARHPADMIKLIWLLPRLFSGHAKQERWAEMLALTDAMQTDDAFRPELFVLRLRLLYCLRRYTAYLALIETIDRGALSALPLGKTFLAVAEKLRHSTASPPPTFVIGLSKTGTTSMAAALDILGLNIADFLDPLSKDLVCFDTVEFYDALSDTPASIQFERLAESYPEAKFIYTVRSDWDWKRSFVAHHHRHHGWPDFATMQSAMARALSGVRSDEEDEGLTAGMNRIWHTLFTRYDNLSEAYAAHDNRVRRYFAGERSRRLLVFDVFNGDGWPELCGFLGKPLPGQPYPMVNVNPMRTREAIAA